MSTNINSTEQIVEINAGDQITNVNIVSQSSTQVISGEQVVTVDVNAGTIPAAWGSITGTLSNQTDLQNALNAKQNNITLTTTGTTGVATLVGATLNIPNYVSSTKQTEWDSAYNDKINSAEVSGTTTKTLTLTQQDGGIIQASWSDFDTAPVTSVFGRTGDVVATEGDYNINQLGDVTITSATNGQVLKYNGTAWVNAADASGLTSVGLAMPSAFTVSGSPLTSNGTITVTGAGTTSQYVRGDGSLAAFPSVSNEAKTLIREVYNKTGATLTKGTVIYIDGGQGNLPTVTKAIATGDPTSAQTFGIVQSDITNMNNGFVVVAGGIDNLDTQAYTEGTALYLSPTTAGAWTSTKPYAPDHMVYLGVVVRSHPTQGVIEVKIQNGVELDEIHDVSARFPTNKDGIFYNSTSGVWENKSIAGVLGYTPVPETRIITINGTAQNLSADRTWSVGTVTSVAASGGTGISVAGSPVTGSGTITITNTAPDQVVGLTGAGTTNISGTYPNFTITSNDQYTGTVTSVAASGGTGISISGSPVTGSGTISITNTAPDQIVSLTGAGTTSISGTYPNFTVTSNDQYVGTVTSVNATVPTGFEVSGVPITTSGTVDIKFASGYSLPTNAKQGQWDDAYAKRIDSLTVTGNSGSATLTSNVLNVPTYTLTGLGGEPAITAGTTSQYWRGDKSFQTLDTSVVPENGNVYFTEPRVRATVLSGLNITGGSISASDSVLNAFGKVQNQINGLIGGSIFQSTWNASTNTPTLASGVGTKGYYYIVSVAGTTNLDGITDWQIGDWAIFDGIVWRKVDNTDAVVSVNGYTGVVSLVLDDLADVSAASPTSNQLLRFNGTSSKWENWTPNYLTTITLTGDVTGSGTSSIATTIGAGKVTNAMLAGSIDYAKMNASTVPTWNQDTTGNAATADKWKTARTLTIGATGKSVDGSGNVTWSASDIGLTNYLPLAGGTLTGSLVGTEVNMSGQGRFKGWYSSGTGIAAEIGVSSSIAHLIGFDRTNSRYVPVTIAGADGAGGVQTEMYINTIGVGIGISPAYKLHVLGSGGTLGVEDANNSADTQTYGILQLRRRTKTTNNGVGMSFNMRDNDDRMVEYGYLGYRIQDPTSDAHHGIFGLYITNNASSRIKVLEYAKDKIEFLYAEDNTIANARRYYNYASNEYRFYAVNASSNTTGVKLMEYDGSTYYQVLTTNTGLSKSGGTVTGNLTVDGQFRVNNIVNTYLAIGPADDNRNGIVMYDTTAMEAGVGGQIVLGYKYTTSGIYTQGAIIRSYKENSTDGHYGSGLKIQVRNDGAALSTKLTLNPSGNLSVVGTVTGSSIIKSGGTSSEFLKADGSVDSSSYITSSVFGAITTSGVLNWNDVTNTKPGSGHTLLLGSATNGFGVADYYHSFNLEYSSKDGTGNVTQLAISYGTPGNDLRMRGRYVGTWTSWVRFLNSDNYNSYSPTLTGGGASGTWGINISGNAATASSANSVAWANIAAGTRTNFNLIFKPNANDYAGFEFKSEDDNGAGFFLVRSNTDSGEVYTSGGITLVADRGWLTLAQRTTASKGVRLMTGTTSTERLKITTAGDIQFVNGNSFTYGGNVILHAANYDTYALVKNDDSEQRIGTRQIYHNNGVNRMNTDPRWNESGYDADLGCLHIWATTGSGVQYGRAGLAFYNGTDYVYLTTKASNSNLFINNSAIALAGNVLALSGGTLTGQLQIGNNTNVNIRFRTATAWDYYLKPSGDNFFIEDSNETQFLRMYYNGGGTAKYVSLLGNVDSYANGTTYINGALVGYGNPSFYTVIGPNDDVRQGLAHYDSTAMAANVGGQLVLGYKYTSAGDYTQGALIRMYKLNGTSGDYSSGIKFQVRNTGEALSTRMTLSPGGNLSVAGTMSAPSGFFESSDIRLKTILNRHESSDFDAIQFKWNDGRDEKLHWGYAAQEVANILPDAIDIMEDGFLSLNYNQIHTYKITMLEKRIKELEEQLKNK